MSVRNGFSQSAYALVSLLDQAWPTSQRLKS
jgi:hypothetical protein